MPVTANAAAKPSPAARAGMRWRSPDNANPAQATSRTAKAVLVFMLGQSGEIAPGINGKMRRRKPMGSDGQRAMARGWLVLTEDDGLDFRFRASRLVFPA